MKFAPEYVTHVLNENFEDAKELLLSPLMAINYAHLVMLAEQGIISAAEARALRDALDGISLENVRAGSLRRHLRGPVLLHREPDRPGLRRGRRRPAAYRAQPERPGDDDVPDGAAGVSRGARRSDAEPARRAARACGASQGNHLRRAHPHAAGAADDDCALPAGDHRAARTRHRSPRRRLRIHQSQSAWRMRHHRHRVPDRSQPHQRAAWLQRPDRATPTAASPPSTTFWKARRRPAC